MGIYDTWKSKNPTQSDKQIANVEFTLKAIDAAAPKAMYEHYIYLSLNSASGTLGSYLGQI